MSARGRIAKHPRWHTPARPTRGMTASMRKALEHVQMESGRQLSLVANAYRPILELLGSLYKKNAPAVRAYEAEMARLRRQRLTSPAFRYGGGRPMPLGIPGDERLNVEMRTLPLPYMRMDVQSSITGQPGTFYSPNAQFDIGGLLTQVGSGQMIVVQEIGGLFTSQDAGPTEVVVSATIDGYCELDPQANIVYASSGVQLVVDKGAAADYVASSARVVCVDTFASTVKSTQGFGLSPTLSVLFDRVPADYHIWLRFVFIAACEVAPISTGAAVLEETATIPYPGFLIFLDH